MFTEILQQPWFGAAVIIVICIVVGAYAMSFFDPLDVDVSEPEGHSGQDSMLDWAGYNASRMANDANALHSHGERIANAGIGIQAAIGARAARDSRVLGCHFLDEDGDVDTKPPLNADQDAMLRKIDMVELQVVTDERWHDRGTPACPAFPVGLIGRGVDIPHPARSEVLA